MSEYEETVTIPVDAGEYPVPEAGLYGPGLQWEADLELYKVEKRGENPGFDKEGTRAPWYRYTWRIMPADGPYYYVREDLSHASKSGSQALERLKIVGCPMEEIIDPDTGKQVMRFNLNEAAPRKFQGGIEMAGPKPYTNKRTGKEGMDHGRILRVFGEG
jgi:hypothetical protein